MDTIRVLIIDEHSAVRQALRTRLEAVPEVDVVGSVCHFTEGLSGLRALDPDVILMELKGRSQEEIDPRDAIAEIVASGSARIIILTSYLDETEREGALRAGARRYLLKDIDTAALVLEIEAVASEKALFVHPPSIVNDVDHGQPPVS